MNRYIDEETQRTLRSYQTQIAAAFFVILAILVAITVIRDLYNQTLTGERSRTLDQSIENRGKLAAAMYVIATLYFAYIAWRTFQKQRTKANLWFLIASELVLIATLVRFITIHGNNVEGIDDII